MAGIHGQPAALLRAARAVTEQLPVMQRGRAAAQRHIAFVGMGSSYAVCYPGVTYLAGRGRAALMLDAAETLHFRLPMFGPDDLVVLVSQSGESAETVAVAESLRGRPEPPTVLTVTNGTANRLTTSADLVLDTGAGPEDGPSTMTFAAALVVVGALARVLTDEEDVAERTGRDAADVATAIEDLLADGELPAHLTEWHGGRATTVILGRGGARAAAEMGALTFKEATGLPVESLQSAQFRHGPLELAGPDLAAMILATEPLTCDLDLRLARDLLALDASVLVVTDVAGAPPYAAEVHIGSLNPLVAPAAAIVPAQLLAWHLATTLGRDPGTYVHASKVTRDE